MDDLLLSTRSFARAVGVCLSCGLLWVGALHASNDPYVIYAPAAEQARTAGVAMRPGIATHYNATGDGACSFGPALTSQPLVAAMNAAEYANAGSCGSFVQVVGPRGSVVVQITDICPECRAGHLDLSRAAFERIAPLRDGRVAIQWRLVSPYIQGPIAFYFKEGSNPWWTAIQIRNHRNPVASLEYLTSEGFWSAIPRTAYNYFVQENPAMGPGPYTFRATDIFGNQIVSEAVPLRVNQYTSAREQFPAG